MIKDVCMSIRIQPLQEQFERKKKHQVTLFKHTNLLFEKKEKKESLTPTNTDCYI